MRPRTLLLSKSQLIFVGLFWGCAVHDVQAPATVPVASDPDLPKLFNTIKWATASEENNFGFDVYRADVEEGPFEKLNELPISGAGNTDETSYYSYMDDTIEADKIYFYYVESISLDGIREQFTPVFRSKPKNHEPAKE